MFSLISAAKARITTAFTFNPTASLQSILTRGYKTHQGAAKRWRKVSNGQFKRKQCGRLHGNVGWSKARNLNHLNGTVLAKGCDAEITRKSYSECFHIIKYLCT